MLRLAAASATVILGTLASVSFSRWTPATPAPPGAAPAPQAPAVETCSDRTLAGKWGTTFGGNFLTGGGLQVIGVLDSDGAGSFTTTGKANVNGLLVTQTGTGTYAVNSDCTGTCTIQYPTWSLDLYFVITGDGKDKQVWFINTSQAAVLHGTVRKL